MSIFPCLKGAAVFAAVTFGFAANADITFSTSGNPDFVLDEDARMAEGSKEISPVVPIAAGLDELIWSAPVPPALTEMMTPEFVGAMPVATGGDQWECMTEALYFEARGEKLQGIFAVADVILNRVDDPRYPDSVCGVVRQGTGKKWMCQFSYYCDGEPEHVSEPKAWEKVGKIARIMLDRADERDVTKGATHYHTKAVNPYWAKVFPRVTTIGYHHFYVEPSRNARG